MGFFAILPLLSACAGAGGPRAASLSEILNIVQARLIASQSFAAVSNGTAVGIGGQVRTGDLSRVRLDFSDASILRLGANTLVTIQDVEPSADPFKRLQMETGRIWISIFGGSINVETPVGTTTVRGSHAYVDLDTIKCVHGTCTFRNAFINVTFGTMQGILLLDGGRSFILFDLTDADVDNFPPSTSATLTAEATRVRTATSTRTNTSTSTSTRTSTTTPTGTLTPTTTSTPTLLFTATPRALACLEPPNPFDPPAGKAVNSTSTIFRWTSNYSLKSDEVFHVLVWTSGAQPNSIGGTRELNLSVDLQKWQFAGAYSNYNWTVQIRRLDGTVLSCAGPIISINYSAPPAPPPAPTAVPPPPPTAVPPTAVRGDKPTATPCPPGTTCR